jgi:hypothetical protein
MGKGVSISPRIVDQWIWPLENEEGKARGDSADSTKSRKNRD